MAAVKEFDLISAIEAACMAYRVNGNEYVKTGSTKIDEETNTVLFYTHTNKSLIQYALGIYKWHGSEPLPKLDITDSDKELAKEIRQHFKRLAFNVVKNNNQFASSLFAILSQPKVKHNELGFIACLPTVMIKDKAINHKERLLRKCKDEHLGSVGETLLDKDCEIIEVKFSEKFNCWSTLAIIDECIVSWFGSHQLQDGPCVIVKAKVKSHGKHWKMEKSETRLNYVKAAQ